MDVFLIYVTMLPDLNLKCYLMITSYCTAKYSTVN